MAFEEVKVTRPTGLYPETDATHKEDESSKIEDGEQVTVVVVGLRVT
jgi:hypothetical protein